MKITVRLYRQTDIDLIGLVCADGVSVSKELKKVLVSFVRGLPYSIQLNPIDATDAIVKKKQVQLQFYLEEKDYMDVIDWLKTLRPRQRNSFLKNLFRSSLPCPYLYMYQTDENKITDMINHIKTYGMTPTGVPMMPIPPVVPMPPVSNPKPTAKKVNTPKLIKKENPIIESKEEKNISPISIPTIEPIVKDNTINTNVNQDEEDMLFNALFNM